MRITVICLLVLCSTLLNAQQVVSAAGSTLENSNGSMSYTIGEGVASTLTKDDKILTQGFHQPSLSIFIISELKDPGFSISTFPNPVKDVLTLTIGKEKFSGLQYLLYDINGKILVRKNLESPVTDIPFETLMEGIYIIKVQQGSSELKTFKIIKQ